MVHVHWHDACSRTGWASVESLIEEHTPWCVDTVGFLLHEDRERIIVGLSVHSDDVAGDSLVIPMTWILSIEEVGHVQGLDGRSSKEGC
jgi:hypothetical protein